MAPKYGWERPLWFAPEGVEPVRSLEFLKPGWKRYVPEEHKAVRNNVRWFVRAVFPNLSWSGRARGRHCNIMGRSNMIQSAWLCLLHAALCMKLWWH